MKARPGVVSVGGTSRLPLGSTGLTTSIDVEGRGTPVAEWPEVQFRRIVGDYFQTMGIPVLKGRMFNDGDAGTAPPVCIVNQTLAAKFFPGEDPVGQQLRNSQTGPPWTIIALVGDVKHGALDEVPQPEMYVSTYQGLDDIALHRDAHERRRGDDDRSGPRRSAQRSIAILPLYSIQTDGRGRSRIRWRSAASSWCWSASSACWR